jgi:hypothetical protein
MTVAATKFVETVRARHEILEALFLAVYAGAARAWYCFEQLDKLPDEETLSAGHPMLPKIQGFKDAKAVAEATAQDAACALMLITDYALRRYRREAKAEDPTFTGTWEVGAQFRNGVSFNKAVWALANQARHFDEWHTLGADGCAAHLSIRGSYETIRTIEYEPLKLNAAREFIAGAKGLNFPSYRDYEAHVLKAVPPSIAAQTGVRVVP